MVQKIIFVSCLAAHVCVGLIWFLTPNVCLIISDACKKENVQSLFVCTTRFPWSILLNDYLACNIIAFKGRVEIRIELGLVGLVSVRVRVRVRIRIKVRLRVNVSVRI
jgi:hypothetical protein